MHTFIDKKNRTWKIDLNFYVVRQIRERCQINLDNIIEEKAKPIEILANNPQKLVDTLFVICEEQLKAADLTDIDFAKGFGGDTLELATKAFLEELYEYLPSSSRRILKPMLEWSQAEQEKSIVEIEQILQDPAKIKELILQNTDTDGQDISE